MIAFAGQSPAELMAARLLAARRPAPPVHVHSDQSDGVLQRKGSCACGGGCPRCQSSSSLQTKGAANQADDFHEQQADASAQAGPKFTSAISSIALTGAIVQPQEAADPSAPQPTPENPADTTPVDNNPQPLTGNAACPVDAVFSSNVAGAGKANCQVPQGQSGAARLAEYIVRGAGSIPAGGLSISEQFTKIDDPYSIFSKLKTVTNTTDSSGKFDDCYILASKETLPPDFVLKVAQNHLYNGQPISKNIITYSASGVGVRHCKRKPDSCDFSDVCRL
jgi:hypothetical protein